MTTHEKAVAAINDRIERLQADLRGAKEESEQRILVQSLLVTVAAAESLTDYSKAVRSHAERLHDAVKRSNEALAARHAELLKSGQELLERLKADPADPSLRKAIERTQQTMAALQKDARRGANSLRRDLAPSLALIDQMAELVRRFSKAEGSDGLKRLLAEISDQVRAFYASQPGLPTRDIIDADAWARSAAAEIDEAAGFDDAYARAGNQVVLALALVTLALDENPPETAAEATGRATAAVTERLKEITRRFAAS